MAIPLATPALIDLVDPYCVIASIFADALIISSLSPGPSCPNTRTQFLGIEDVSIASEPGMLSIPITVHD